MSRPPWHSQVKGAVYRATAVEAAMKGSPLTVEQINRATTLAAAKPMAMNTYKLALSRGSLVRFSK
jgi:hypothetical protein